MSHVASQPDTPSVSARTPKLVSPLAIVMALVSAYGLVAFYRADQITITVDGWTIFFASAGIWLAYGALAIALVVSLQRYARRPAWTIALALAWGAFAGTYFAATANDAFSTIFQNAWGSDNSIWITGPLVEESIKAVGVIALVLVPVLRRFGPVDGLFYGVVVGAGFQVFENFSYSLSQASQVLDGQWQAVWANLFLRGVFGLFTHAVWTGIVGAGIGWAAVGGRSGRLRRILVAVGAFLAAVVLHGVEDWTAEESMVALTLAVDLFSLLILVLVLLRLQRYEKQRLIRLAVENDGWGVLDTTDLTAREAGRAGRKARRRELRYAYAHTQYGPDSPLTRRAEAKLT